MADADTPGPAVSACLTQNQLYGSCQRKHPRSQHHSPIHAFGFQRLRIWSGYTPNFFLNALVCSFRASNRSSSTLQLRGSNSNPQVQSLGSYRLDEAGIRLGRKPVHHPSLGSFLAVPYAPAAARPSPRVFCWRSHSLPVLTSLLAFALGQRFELRFPEPKSSGLPLAEPKLLRWPPQIRTGIPRINSPVLFHLS